MRKKKGSERKKSRERNSQKIKKVLKKKGYKTGELPKGKELHHIKPVGNGGKTTPKNTRVVSRAKHKKIHKNRRKRGEI